MTWIMIPNLRWAWSRSYTNKYFDNINACTKLYAVTNIRHKSSHKATLRSCIDFAIVKSFMQPITVALTGIKVRCSCTLCIQYYTMRHRMHACPLICSFPARPHCFSLLCLMSWKNGFHPPMHDNWVPFWVPMCLTAMMFKKIHHNRKKEGLLLTLATLNGQISQKTNR